MDDTHPAWTLLAGWDHRLLAESGPAALFEIWFAKHLVPGVMRALAPEGLPAMVAVPDTQLTLAMLEGEEHAVRRDALLRETLTAAWDEAATLLGPDPAGWAWGKLHQGYFEHPLSRLVPDLAARLDVGPAPKGGSNLTINSPGQSGDPDSLHYRDLFPLWARDEYVPMLFSEAAVDAAAEARILLRAM